MFIDCIVVYNNKIEIIPLIIKGLAYYGTCVFVLHLYAHAVDNVELNVFPCSGLIRGNSSIFVWFS